MNAEEVAESRFGQGEYSHETQIIEGVTRGNSQKDDPENGNRFDAVQRSRIAFGKRFK